MATRIWTGLGDGTSWNDAANWDGGVPTSTDDVIIDRASFTNIIVPADAQAASLTVRNAGIISSATASGEFGPISADGATIDFNATTASVTSTISLANSSTLTANNPGGTAELVIAAAGTVQGAGNIIDNVFGFSGSNNVTNLGTINANVNGQTLAIQNRFTAGTTFINHGVAEASNGGRLSIEENLGKSWTNAADGTISEVNSTLELSGPFSNAGQIIANGGMLNLDGTTTFGSVPVTWVNTGTITATGAVVNIAGNETVAQIGSLSRTGGQLNYVKGTLDNTGGTLDASTASLLGMTLLGGTIHGGVLDQAGLGLVFGYNSNNTLDGVTVRGGLSLLNGWVTLSGGTVVQNAAGTDAGVIALDGSILTLRNGQPAVTLDQTVSLANSSTLTAGTQGANASLTIGVNGLVQGAGSVADTVFPVSGTIDLDNLGTINASVNGQTLAITTTTFVNDGLAEATNGGRLAIEENRARAWTNAASGIISETNSTLELSGPFTNAGQIIANGGTLNLDGTTTFGSVPVTWVNTGAITATDAIVNVFGNESGTGTLTLGGTSTAFVHNAVAAGQTFAFGSSAQVITLFDPSSFQASLSGFEQGDLVVLRNRSVDTVTQTANTVTLSFQGNVVGTLNLQGDYSQVTFNANSDGQGNTLVGIGVTNHAPVFNSSPITSSITESGTVSVQGTIDFTDLDAGDTAGLQITSRLVSAAGAGLVLTQGQSDAFANAFAVNPTTGAWSFNVPASVARFLVAGDSVQVTNSVTATDSHFLTSQQTETFTVLGANEAPIISSAPADRSFIDDGSPILATGAIAFADPDRGDNATASLNGPPQITVVGAALSAEQEAGLANAFQITDAQNGSWSFTFDDPATLPAGATLTAAYQVAITDANGAATLQTETFHLTGFTPPNQTPVFNSPAIDQTITEVGAAISATGTIVAIDPDAGDVVSRVVTQRVVSPSGGVELTAAQQQTFQNAFSLDSSSGAWSLNLAALDTQFLNAGDSVTLSYTVRASDDNGAATEQIERFTINGSSGAGSGPVVTAPGALGAFAGITTQLTPVTVQDPDIGALPVTVLVSDASGLLSATAAAGHGTVVGAGSRQLTISGSLADINAILGSLTYFAAATGQDTITIQAIDNNGQSLTQQIAVSASEVPLTTPLLVVPDKVQLVAGTPTAIGGVKVVDPHAQATGQQLSLVFKTNDGTLTANGGPGGTVTGQGTDTITITGTVDEINSYLSDAVSAETVGKIAAGAALVAGLAYAIPTLFNALLTYKIPEPAQQSNIGYGGPLADIISKAAAAAEKKPFIETFGGQIYQFDGVGEYVLAKSTVTGDTFEVQARLAPDNGSQVASVITEIAANIGSDRVTFGIGRPDLVWVDGAPAAISQTSPLQLAAGQLTQITADTYRLTWNTGESLLVKNHGTYLGTGIALGANNGPGSIAGLFGTNDGPANDFTLPDGTVLPQTLTSDQLYHQFTDAWRVTQGPGTALPSLLDYALGQTTATFTDTTFPRVVVTLADLPSSVVDHARQVVAAAGITDPALADALSLSYILSGGDSSLLTLDFANAARPMTTAPVTSSGPAPLLIGLSAPVEKINAAASGPTLVTFDVLLNTVSTTDAHIRYTVVPGGAGYLDAAAFGGTLPSGQLTIAAGATAGQIQIDVPQGSLGTAAYKKLAIQITSDDGTPLFAPTSTETLIAPPTPGPQAIAELAELATLGKFTHIGNTYTLDLGDIGVGQPLPAISFALTNAAGSGADNLSGNFAVSRVDGFTVTGAGLGSSLAAGQTYSGLTVQPNTGLDPEATVKLGYNSEVIVFHPRDSNPTGYSAALPDITLQVTYNLVPANKIYSAAWGDVHIITFNHSWYNFQAVGEFTLAKSRVPGDTFDIQMRLEPAAFASVVGQAAVTIGSDRVTFDVHRPDLIWVNGTPVNLSLANPTLDLSGGTLTELTPTTFKVDWITGEELTVFNLGTHLDLYDAIPKGLPGSIGGLQGFDLGQDSEFVLPDGTVLPQPLTLDQLYGQYADAWRVSQATSLLDYGPGQTTETFTDLNFPIARLTLADFPTDVVARATALVTAAGITDPATRDAAVLDYLLTGDPSYLDGALGVQQSGLTNNVQAVPAPGGTGPLAVGVSATAARVTETAAGATQVTFEVYLTGVAAADTIVHYSVVSPGAGFFDAATFGGTLPTGDVTIIAGQRTATFTIDVPAGALGSQPSEILEVQVSSPSGSPVAADLAQTEVINELPQPGAPAAAVFAKITGPGTLTHVGNDYTLDLGSITQGELNAPIWLALANVAAATGDDLGGIFGVPLGSGFTITGNSLPGPISPGASYQGLNVRVLTSDLGTHSETLTFLPLDINDSGYSAALPSLTLTILDTVIAPAEVALNTPDIIVFPNVRVGDVESLPVSITNMAAIGAGSLNVTPTASGDAQATGTIVRLAPGATDYTSIKVGLATDDAGAHNGFLTLQSATDDPNGPDAPIPPSPTIDVFGSVYRTAAPSVTPPASTILHVGDPGTAVISVANAAPADGYSETLLASIASTTGGFFAINGSSGPIAAGASSGTLSVGFSTAAAGVFSGLATLDLTSDGGIGAGSIDGLGTILLASQTVPVSVTINNFAVPELHEASGGGTFSRLGNAYTLDLGTLELSSGPVVVALDVANAASGPADLLSGTVDATLSGPFVDSLLTFGSIGAGGSASLGTITLDTATAGTFSHTITVHSTGANASGFSAALADMTLTVTATIKGLPPTLAIAATDAEKTEGNGGTTDFTFTVTRSGDLSEPSSVTYAVTGSGASPADASDFGGGALPSATITFAAGQASQIVHVAVAGDSVVEPDEGFTVALSAATGATIATPTANGTIRNDDVAPPPPVVSIGIAPTSVEEGGSFALTASRSGDDLSQASTVTYTIDGAAGNEGDISTPLTGTLTIAAGQQSTTLSIATVEDTVAEPDKSFTVTIASPINGNIGTGTASATILDDDVAPPPNRPPVAADDTANTTKGRAITIAVLANDSDPDNDVLTVTAVSNPKHGRATVNADNTVTYKPNAGYTGVDAFTYTVDDGNGGSASATVNVSVSPPNHAPVICSNEISKKFIENGCDLSASGRISFTDSDSGDHPTASVTSVSVTSDRAILSDAQKALLAAGFQITNAATGAWSFQLDGHDVAFLAKGQSLKIVETVTVDDHHGGTATQVETFVIKGSNGAPVITSDGGGGKAMATAKDGHVTTVVAVDPDQGDHMTYAIQGANRGSLFTIDGATGELSIANTARAGSYSVTVKATDAYGASDTQTIKVTVAGAGAVHEPYGGADAFVFASGFGEIASNGHETGAAALHGAIEAPWLDLAELHATALSGGHGAEPALYDEGGIPQSALKSLLSAHANDLLL